MHPFRRTFVFLALGAVCLATISAHAQLPYVKTQVAQPVRATSATIHGMAVPRGNPTTATTMKYSRNMHSEWRSLVKRNTKKVCPGRPCDSTVVTYATLHSTSSAGSHHGHALKRFRKTN